MREIVDLNTRERFQNADITALGGPAARQRKLRKFCYLSNHGRSDIPPLKTWLRLAPVDHASGFPMLRGGSAVQHLS
eukprot:1402905-Pyramimonas_sp.AAC.1